MGLAEKDTPPTSPFAVARVKAAADVSEETLITGSIVIVCGSFDEDDGMFKESDGIFKESDGISNVSEAFARANVNVARNNVEAFLISICSVSFQTNFVVLRFRLYSSYRIVIDRDQIRRRLF